MSKSVSFNGLEGYTDTVMGGVAFGEIFCVLAAGKTPTTPDAWRKAFHAHGHGNNPEALYAHAIAAGMLVPKGDELHLSAEVAKHANKVKLLKAPA